jgi:hypothetical protein
LISLFLLISSASLLALSSSDTSSTGSSNCTTSQLFGTHTIPSDLRQTHPRCRVLGHRRVSWVLCQDRTPCRRESDAPRNCT